jgi:hypothetical protein
LAGLIAMAAKATAVMVALANANDGGRRWPGTVLITVSAIAFSLAGLFTRLIDLDVWTVLFWRALFGGIFIAGYIVWCPRLFYIHSRWKNEAVFDLHAIADWQRRLGADKSR